MNRTAELAKEISHDYGHSDKAVELVCVLKGSSVFFHHLMNFLALERLQFGFNFLRVKSYEGTSSTGNVKIMDNSNLGDNLEGKHVIVVEDIVDTGITLSKLLPMMLNEYKPCSLETCTLLEKRIKDPSLRKVSCRYTGFSIPDKFVIGFGLDFNEAYRDLLDIWIISQKGIVNEGLITRGLKH